MGMTNIEQKTTTVLSVAKKRGERATEFIREKMTSSQRLAKGPLQRGHLS